MIIVTIPFNKCIRGILGLFAIVAVLLFAHEPTHIQLAGFCAVIFVRLLFTRVVWRWVTQTLISLGRHAYKIFITKEV